MRNPAVTAASQMPRRNRTAESPPKFVMMPQACTTPRTRWRYLCYTKSHLNIIISLVRIRCSPDPFTHRKPLQSKILGILKCQVAELEHCTEPVKLIGINVCWPTGRRVRTCPKGATPRLTLFSVLLPGRALFCPWIEYLRTSSTVYLCACMQRLNKTHRSKTIVI